MLTGLANSIREPLVGWKVFPAWFGAILGRIIITLPVILPLEAVAAFLLLLAHAAECNDSPVGKESFSFDSHAVHKRTVIAA